MHMEITPKAREQLVASGVGNDTYLRVAVRPGGCAGMTYDLLLDTRIDDQDAVLYAADDIKVVADKSAVPFVNGLIIDYSDDLVASGFRITNPNAVQTCGCGSSFGC